MDAPAEVAHDVLVRLAEYLSEPGEHEDDAETTAILGCISILCVAIDRHEVMNLAEHILPFADAHGFGAGGEDE